MKTIALLFALFVAGCDASPPPTCSKCGGPIELEAYRVGYEAGRLEGFNIELERGGANDPDFLRGMADGQKRLREERAKFER